jgi:hypothetical protein
LDIFGHPDLYYACIDKIVGRIIKHFSFFEVRPCVLVHVAPDERFGFFGSIAEIFVLQLEQKRQVLTWIQIADPDIQIIPVVKDG